MPAGLSVALSLKSEFGWVVTGHVLRRAASSVRTEGFNPRVFFGVREPNAAIPKPRGLKPTNPGLPGTTEVVP